MLIITENIIQTHTYTLKKLGDIRLFWREVSYATEAAFISWKYSKNNHIVKYYYNLK